MTNWELWWIFSRRPLHQYQCWDTILTLVFHIISKYSNIISISPCDETEFSYEAGGSHDPPYTDEEEDAIVEAKKKDPPSVDEVFENLLIGNKAAAEDAKYLQFKAITHVLNLASNRNLKFFVAPDEEDLKKHGITLKEMKLRDKSNENITTVFR